MDDTHNIITDVSQNVYIEATPLRFCVIKWQFWLQYECVYARADVCDKL